ncbi:MULTISPECIES: hypothetical protein [unclassified Aureispira]|uniref:hypothetical protein n=1 Tax=unclassified Aureispira TaxID=2649989 RepID=UPI0006965C2E|nr:MULTISPECIES: hypothetical protein [unclassified Aureispira]WMX14454.1 hypothetical protein QP953_26715 [Aureispira sp. CCB-E]
MTIHKSSALSVFYLAILLLIMGCASQNNNANTTERPGYRFLSKKEASKWIVIDEKEDFFGKVAPLEMSIQMKENREEDPRTTVLEDYKKMLQDDLQEFSKEEKEIATKLFDRALELSYKVNPNLKLPEIFLIKTAGKYYGPSVYYTRDNSIIIPAPMLTMAKDANDAFLSTMIHEIFHIYSRYNKDKRDALYQRIGFEKLPELNLSDFLKKRVLYNPDGVDLRYAITVKEKETGREFEAIPVIYSRYKAYTSDLNAFFGYLTFQLFEVKNRAGVWSVVNKDVGYSIDEITGFWEQVGRNTQYNIHPDELCADNFVIMALAKANDGKNLEKLSAEGQKLVQDLQAIILE